MRYTFHVKTKKRETGDLGESIAAEFLERKGFKILEKNYLRPWGEIDLIALKDYTVRFVEVKTVSREKMPDFSREIDYRPEEMVQKNKLRKLARTAALYMEQKRDSREYQIDVVGVILVQSTQSARCRLIEQALEDNI